MQKLKSLTLIIATSLLIGCGQRQSSETFSSSINSSSSLTTYDRSETDCPPTYPSSSKEVSSSSSLNSSSFYSSSEEQSSSIEQSSSSEQSSSEEQSSSSSASSQVIDDGSHYNGYYDDLVSWTNGEDLKNQLNAIIRNGYKPLSYTKSSKQNYATNIHADHSKYDFEYLDVIYSDKNTFKTETNKGWQREHAWCASLMCGSTTGEAIKKLGRATDFHNLFAANASANQSRGNKNYGYANVIDSMYTDRTVNDGNDGYSYDEFIFEPADIDKGRLARAIFYMATMYKDDEVDDVNNINMKGLRVVEDPVSYVAGNNCAFAIGNLSELLEWSTKPVDYLEMQHNIAVYQDKDNIDGYAQGNRNPYIDYPGLVDYVYGAKKDQAGTLKDVIASASYLDCENDEFSHFAIKEAKRDYGYGDALTVNDYEVVKVLNNYDYESTVAMSSIGNTLNNHTFSENDGEKVTAEIVTANNHITYQINLNPMGSCSSGILPITTTGINKKTPNSDQSVTFDNVSFYFNFVTTFADVSTTGMTINNISAGGITIGSSNRSLTKLTLTTKESYTIDKAYIKAMSGNVSSSYSLTIKVGDNTIASKVVNDSTNWKVFGDSLEESLTGQISFIFIGSASLKINSIAFNALI